MPCQQLRLPLLKRLADFQMSAVAKALVTSSNWKVGRWEVRTFQELWVSIDWGYPKIIIFLRGDFPYTNHFGDLPWKTRNMSEKYVGKDFLEITSTVVNLLGTLVGIFFHNVYFVLKFSLKGTLSRRYQKTCLCLSTCQGEVVFDQGSDRHKTCTTRYGLITLPLWDWLRRRRCRQVLHHSERWSPLVAQELSVCCMNSQHSGRSSCCISGCQNMCMLYACKQKLH